MYSHNRYLIALLLANCFAAGQAASAQTISDGEFVDWTFISTGQEPGDQATVTREPSGGNPGAHLRIETQIPVPSGSAAGLAIYEGGSTTQILDGLTIQFSIDARRVTGDAQLLSLLLRQGNTIYQLPLDTIFAPQGSWANFTFQSTFSSQSNFIRIVGTGPESPDLNGGVVTYFGISGTNGASGRTYDWDNFNLVFGERQCSDGVDNDLDGLIDHPNDPGCIGPTDDTENTDNRNLVVNPSFEQGPLAWTFSSPDAGTCAQPCVIPSMGLNAAFKNFTGGGAGTIRQEIPTIPGRRYVVELGLAINGSAFGNVRAEFGSTVGVSVSQADLGTSYVFFSFDHVATSSSTEFILGGLVTGGTFFLDDISVVDETTQSLFECGDGLDNDSDGLIDFPSDPGCASASDDDEFNIPLPECSDGVDNDFDGLIDFPADPDCDAPTDSVEAPDTPIAQCNDGVDNDNDGLIDFPMDRQCRSSNDDDEAFDRQRPTATFEFTGICRLRCDNYGIGDNSPVVGQLVADANIVVLRQPFNLLAKDVLSIDMSIGSFTIDFPGTQSLLTNFFATGNEFSTGLQNIRIGVNSIPPRAHSFPFTGEPDSWAIVEPEPNGNVRGAYGDSGEWRLVDLNFAPVARPGRSRTVRPGDTVYLDGSGSFDDNTASEDLLYEWAFLAVPTGSDATLLNANTATPSFVTDVAGTYRVSLAVTDEQGLISGPTGVVVSSSNLAPTADAGPDQLVVVGSPVFLDASASSDPENDPLFFNWQITGRPIGSTTLLTNENMSIATFVPDFSGVYNIELVVSDAIGPGEPDSVAVTATVAGDFAVIQIVLANDAIIALPLESVTTKGNRNALTNFLRQAIEAIDENDLAEAVNKLEKALIRVDGCAQRGSPDGNGPGRDWITNCSDQAVVYDALEKSLDALTE